MKMRRLAIKYGELVWRVVREVAIIFGCGFAVFYAVRVFSSPANRGSRAAPRGSATVGALAIGSRLALPCLEGDRSGPTVFLVTSPQCKYCLQSKDFHKKLFAHARARGIPFHVLVENTTESTTYLESLGVSQSEICEANFREMRIGGTPAILIMDSGGLVQHIWIGRLGPGQEGSVESAMLGTVSQQPPGDPKSRSELADADLPAVMQAMKGRAVILDVRERDGFEAAHRPGAKNIPFDELRRRLPHELEPSQLVIVDCSNEIAHKCEIAVEVLQRAGFSRTTILNKSRFRTNLCEACGTGL